MSYIGPKPSQTLATPTSQYFNGTGSQTVFTLNRAVNVSEDLEVFVNNIQQEPGVGKSYTATGTTLTFDGAPSSGTANVYVVYRGLAEVTTRLEHDPNAALAATTGTFSGNVDVTGTVTASGDIIRNDVTLGTSKFALQYGGSDAAVFKRNNSTGVATIANGYAGAPVDVININLAGNVGIGTSSPVSKLDLASGNITISNSTNAPYINFVENTTRSQSLSRITMDQVSGTAGQLLFSTTTGGTLSEAMRIDISGNLLIGTTSSTIYGGTTTGINLNPDGATSFNRASGQAAMFNRISTDGDIVQFRKDGSTVGSIGNYGSYLQIDTSGYSGLFLGSGAVFPKNNGSLADATTSFGSSSYRFKDLYLSGGAYLGGTGSANHLDDYEIGAWNPSFILSSGTATGVAYGRYIKVGQLVYVTFYLQITSGSGTIDYITNLPFASENSGSWAAAGNVRETAQTGYQWHTYVYPNQNYMLLRRYDNTNGFAVNYTWAGSVTYTTP